MIKRSRYAKVVATLGPTSHDEKIIENLFLKGADLFRLNFSHGTKEDHLHRINAIRNIEKKYSKPIGIIGDLQGPKLRVGVFEDGKIFLSQGQKFRLDLSKEPGSHSRVNLPHPEIFKGLEKGTRLLLDDGKIVLEVERCSDQSAETKVIVGGILSNRKGLNVPNILLPISAITEKDKEDILFALDHNLDFIALSFVQKPEDVLEAKEYIGDKAWIISKLEKPLVFQSLDKIIELSDGIMIARGDLGVELPCEEVPVLQKEIIRHCRRLGRPVIVATQMLESMINHPTPTRAEASDVATAIYDGSDAVMLSAESASGQYPVEAVSMMDKIIQRVEADPYYRKIAHDIHDDRPQTVTDSIAAAVHQVSKTINVSCIVTFSESGFTTLRVSREKPLLPILSLTPVQATARRMALVWGVHAILVEDLSNFTQVVMLAHYESVRHEFAKDGDQVIVTAGVPFGQSGATNVLRIIDIKTESH